MAQEKDSAEKKQRNALRRRVEIQAGKFVAKYVMDRINVSNPSEKAVDRLVCEGKNEEKRMTRRLARVTSRTIRIDTATV